MSEPLKLWISPCMPRHSAQKVLEGMGIKLGEWSEDYGGEWRNCTVPDTAMAELDKTWMNDFIWGPETGCP